MLYLILLVTVWIIYLTVEFLGSDSYSYENPPKKRINRLCHSRSYIVKLRILGKKIWENFGGLGSGFVLPSLKQNFPPSNLHFYVHNKEEKNTFFHVASHIFFHLLNIYQSNLSFYLTTLKDMIDHFLKQKSFIFVLNVKCNIFEGRNIRILLRESSTKCI